MENEMTWELYERLAQYRRELVRLINHPTEKLSFYKRRTLYKEVDRITERIRPMESKLSLMLDGDITQTLLYKNHHLDKSRIPTKCSELTLKYFDDYQTINDHAQTKEVA